MNLTPQQKRKLRRAARRTADSIAALAPPQQIVKVNAVVASVAAGGGSDGGDVVTITLGDDTLPVVHLGPTPAVGAMVAVLIVDGSPLCLGTPTGIPT